MSKALFYPGLSLLLQLPKLEERVHIRVLGWDIDKFLITNLPYINERPIKLKSEDNCIIRFLKGDDAYGFQTNVISMQFFPAPLIFFKYPTNVDKMPFRKSKRFRLNIQAKALNPATVHKIDVNISDISSSGCRLCMPNHPEHKYDIGDRIYLTFNILEKSIEADCVVRNINQTGNTIMLGMEFINMAAPNRELINAFIDMLSKVPDAH